MQDQKTSQTLPADLPSRGSVSVRSQASPELAASRTALLFGCYRRGDANDPEIYTAAIAATLADFSQEVVEYVTDPRTGLAAKMKWLPSVAEVREACEAHEKFILGRNRLLAKGWRMEGNRLIRPEAA